jgi:REP element-mobilizing transposase RayT
MNIHLIFHTKHATPIRKEDLERVHSYIGGIIKGMGENPIAIGGTENHVHILATLPKTMALSDYVRTIKAESSRWVKSVDSYYRVFAWQEGYGTFSVSASKVETIKTYIRNQEEHHKKTTFVEEYKSFLKAYGTQYDERYLESE